MSVHLRIITADDWEALRSVRLRALADSPDAFGRTLAEVEPEPEPMWRERAEGSGPVVVAFDDERPVAMGALFAPEDSDVTYVWGMWVEPEWRGQGLGGRILRSLLQHARRDGRAVVLHVTEGNDGARRLYERHGFVATGHWEPLREGSDLRVETMRRSAGG